MTILKLLKELFRILEHPLNKEDKFNAFWRIIWWKINRIFFQLPVIITLNNQIKCICYPLSSCGGQVVYYNLPEYPEMNFMQKVIKNNSVFVDVGANMGIFTLYAATKIKKGRIYAFEPVPKVLDILYQNIRINNLDKIVTASEKVVSDHNGIERFVIEDMFEWSHISSDKFSKHIKLSSVKLDTFLGVHNIDFVDLIKIDVEGGEIKVLTGLEDYLKNGKVGALIVELNADGRIEGVNAQSTLDYIRKFKYVTYNIGSNLRLKEIREADNSRTHNIVAILQKKVKSFKAVIES